MPMPNVGDAAPAFTLADQSGETHLLSDYAGKHVVLYFYPKDDTPGCTVEACAFRDDQSKLQAAGAVVFGVSPDDSKSHRKFADKFRLNFPLLADTDRQLVQAYGAWGEKSLYGRKFMGVLRSTFHIGPDGKIAHVWPKVKVDGHSAEVLAAITGNAAAVRTASTKNVATKNAPAAKKVASKNALAAKKPAAKKPAAKKPAAKKPAAKKPAAKKPAAKKPAAKKPAAKKPAAKKPAARK